MQARDDLAAVLSPSQLARAQKISLPGHVQWGDAKGRPGPSLGKTAQSQLEAASPLWRNPQHFHPQFVRGIADGLWSSAVTMTAVGYGDKTLVTWAGCLVCLIWMFASVFLMAFFAAVQVRCLLPDGSYERLRAQPGDTLLSSQA